MTFQRPPNRSGLMLVVSGLLPRSTESSLALRVSARTSQGRLSPPVSSSLARNDHPLLRRVRLRDQPIFCPPQRDGAVRPRPPDWRVDLRVGVWLLRTGAAGRAVAGHHEPWPRPAGERGRIRGRAPVVR